MGDPVYGGYFQRTLHVDPQLALNPETPLLEDEHWASAVSSLA